MVSIPEHMEAAIVRSLAKDPAERFATADEFAKALAGLEAARPATPAAPPPTAAAPAGTGKKGCAGMLVAGVGLAGAAAYLWQLL